MFALRWQAEHLSLHHPDSFYNGFFPIGFPLLLRFASITGNPVFTLLLLQIAIAPYYAVMIDQLLCKLISARAAAIALPLVLFAPPVLHAISSPTPDFFAALAVLSGCLFLTRGNQWDMVLAGASFGLACLFRSHILALVLAIGIVILWHRKESRSRALMEFGIGTLPFILAQGLLQVWSGHGFFENAQAFNIWKTMHGMDWSNPPALGQAHVFDIILADPSLFVQAVWNWIVIYSFYIVPLVGVIALGAGYLRKKARVVSEPLILLTIAALLYILLTAAGGSVSTFTPILPIAAACIGCLLDFIFGKVLQTRVRFAPTFSALCWAAGLTGLFVITLRNADRVEDYATIEHQLQVYFMGSTQTTTFEQIGSTAAHIYTDDYDLYFPASRYCTPRISGGWPEVGLPNYLNAFPHIRNNSAKTEHDDLILNGIGIMIYRTPPYDPIGYHNLRDDTSLFSRMFTTKHHEVYRVNGAVLR